MLKSHMYNDLGNQELYCNLTETIQRFLSEIEKSDLNKKIYDKWTVEDILKHITFWHLNYADNLEAEESGGTLPLLSGKYHELNAMGVEAMKDLSKDELITKLIDAHKRIGAVVERGKVKKMTYKKGSRDYEIPELLVVINSHIKGHYNDIRRATRNTN